jgi:excisionase family DNA binding protein
MVTVPAQPRLSDVSLINIRGTPAAWFGDSDFVTTSRNLSGCTGFIARFSVIPPPISVCHGLNPRTRDIYAVVASNETIHAPRFCVYQRLQKISELRRQIMMQTSEWLTAAEAAQYLKISPRTVVEWARTGKIKGHVLSGAQRHTWRFRTEELDAMLKSPAVLPTEGRVN